MNPMRAPILAPLSGRNVWNTFPEVKTPGGRDRSLSDIAFDASRSTTVRFCDVGSSRSAAHEDVRPPPLAGQRTRHRPYADADARSPDRYRPPPHRCAVTHIRALSPFISYILQPFSQRWCPLIEEEDVHYEKQNCLFPARSRGSCRTNQCLSAYDPSRNSYCNLALRLGHGNRGGMYSPSQQVADCSRSAGSPDLCGPYPRRPVKPVPATILQLFSGRLCPVIE